MASGKHNADFSNGLPAAPIGVARAATSLAPSYYSRAIATGEPQAKQQLRAANNGDININNTNNNLPLRQFAQPHQDRHMSCLHHERLENSSIAAGNHYGAEATMAQQQRSRQPQQQQQMGASQSARCQRDESRVPGVQVHRQLEACQRRNLGADHEGHHSHQRHDEDDDETNYARGRDHYADQLRRSQAQQRIGLHQQQNQHQHQHQTPAQFQPSGAQRSQQPPAAAAAQGQQQMTSASSRGAHVNFGQRSSQNGGAATMSDAHLLEDEEEGNGESTRKKKYLTAKYGAQQMNLIKKRLKIEMWLHEQLQELAKKSSGIGPDELDELDIDLDQLLDLEDDATRARSLRRTLAPLGDLPREAIDEFIGAVLEQSKLL